MGDLYLPIPCYFAISTLSPLPASVSFSPFCLDVSRMVYPNRTASVLNGNQ